MPSKKTSSEEQFRFSQHKSIPIENEVLIDSNPEANQEIDFKSALMGNLTQREEVRNIQVVKLIYAKLTIDNHLGLLQFFICNQEKSVKNLNPEHRKRKNAKLNYQTRAAN